MYRALLRAQWPTMGPYTLILTIISFAAPLVLLTFGIALRANGDPGASGDIISTQVLVGPAYPMLAWLLGLFLAAGIWNDDTQGKHIYALILPVPRWYYLLLRFGTGLTYLVIPVIALGVASLLAASQVELPPGLHAYPGGLMVRYGLTAALSFSFIFAAGSASEKTVRRGAVAFIAAFALLIIIGLASEVKPDAFIRSLFAWPSFIDSFVGRWLLFDV